MNARAWTYRMRQAHSVRMKRYWAQRRAHPKMIRNPEKILARCALTLNCEPRQVYDRLLERLKENATKATTKRETLE
jgi:hypothetical protein